MSYKAVPWRGDSTWRKLGFIHYGDSREFRKVLEDNPNFNIGFEPPEGDLIFIEDDLSISDNTSGNLETITLTDFAGATTVNGPEDDYPWTSYGELYKRLENYTSYSLENYEDLNGFKS